MLLQKKVIFVRTKIKRLMRTKYCFVFLFIFPFYTLFAQEDPRVTLFPWLQPFYNPAAMGEKDNHINFTGVFRQHALLAQVKDEEASAGSGSDVYKKAHGEQFLLNMDSYIKAIRGAVGVMFVSDKNGGNFENIHFKFGYTTKIRIQGGKLGIGAHFGFLNMKEVKERFNPNQTPDPVVDMSLQASVLDFDMSFGVHYRAPTWHAGISCTQLLGGVRISGEKNLLHVPQQLYITGGYIWDLRTPAYWTIEPNVIIRSNFTSWSIDVMAAARYNGILWFGISYQLDWAVAAFFGTVPFYNKGDSYLKGLEIGVSYSFPTAKSGFRANGSKGDIEILIRYGLNFYREKPLTGYGSSRHLYKNQ